MALAGALPVAFPLAWAGFAVLLAPALRGSEAPSGPKRRVTHWAGAFACFVFPVNFALGHWIPATLQREFGLPWLACWLAFLVLCAAYSAQSALFGAAFGWLLGRARVRRSAVSRAATAVVFLSLWDFLEPRLFPYSAVQFSESSVDLFASAYLLGPLGSRALFFLMSAALALTLVSATGRKARVIASAAALGLLGLQLGIGRWAARGLQARFFERQPVLLLQDNTWSENARIDADLAKHAPFHARFAEARAGIERKLADGARSARAAPASGSFAPEAELWAFWSETAFPLMEPSALRERLTAILGRDADLQLAGFVRKEAGPAGSPSRIFNSVAMIHAASPGVSSYDKTVLFPLGEFIPFEERIPVLRSWFPGLGSFSRPTSIQVLPHPSPGGPVFVILICNEVLDAGYIDRSLAEARRSYPGRGIVLVSPASDYRFGLSLENRLHSMIARWQAVTRGLPMIRANGFAYSEVVAPWGEVLARSEGDRTQVVSGGLPVERQTRRPHSP